MSTQQMGEPPVADDWPVQPALKLYDIKTDDFRPCTQAELDKLVILAAAAMRAYGNLQHAVEKAGGD